MCTAPPLAVDRLVGLAGANKSLIGSMEEGKLASRMKAELLEENLTKVCGVLTKLLDRDIFPWLDTAKDPNDHERDRASTIVADRLCSAVANPIVRNAQEQRQLAMIGDYLDKRGYRKQPHPAGKPLTEMQPATYSFPWLAAGVLAVLCLAFAVTFDYSVLARSDLQARSWGLAFPVIGVLALAGIVIGAREKRDGLPFALTVLFFLAAFLSLGVMFWPYMIPYSITVANAAAPEASLEFLFYGGIVVLPVIAAYTIGVYWVFRGKVRTSDGGMS